MVARWSQPVRKSGQARRSLSDLHFEAACLDLEAELDLVADEHTAALERLVPVQPEVLAVELSLRPEPGDLDARRVDAAPLVLRRERDRTGDVLDRDLAFDD